MLRVELPALIERLNEVCRQGLEQAALLCAQHQSPEVTVGHLLLAMLDQPLCDVRCILNNVGVDHLALRSQLAEEIRSTPSTEVTTPTFSPLLVELLQDSWLLTSVEYPSAHLRSGAILTALLHDAARYLGIGSLRLLSDINRESVRRQLVEMTANSAEAPREELGHQAQLSEKHHQTDNDLARFTTSLTEQARQGGLDPVLGRDPEIDQMLDILGRRRKNNPIVVGDAGVGKSAVVEGLAARIVAGKVPTSLAGVELLSLDLGALQAGASIKGEFEKRLKGVINAVKNASRPTLLFIDEAHTLIGAGNQEGGADAANLLKPALARGELRTIAATTWREYKKYIEKDPALSRRFQPIALKEPSVEQALVILRGLRDVYEHTHGVLISDGGLRAAAALSARYIAGRQLPDKAIDVLDTACTRLSQALDTPPRKLSHLQSEHTAALRESEQLSREQLLGRQVDPSLHRALKERVQALENELDSLNSEWKEQRKCVSKIISLQAQLLDSTEQKSAFHYQDIEKEDALSNPLSIELAECERQLAALQKNTVLVNPSVEEAQIAQVIGDWTGVPVERMTSDEFTKLADLPDHLGKQVQGQSVAITRIHRHLLTARADLRRPGRPLGAFLLVGPSGVGKTETAVQIAEQLYGGRQFLTTINMSEYQEKHTVSRLIGSPPGYVGFGEGGLLTEAIRQRPYSIVLLDEVEKAHPDVLNLFYQSFDKGELADGEGRLIDCRNILFFMTSNLGYEAIVAHRSDDAALNAALYPVLAEFFKPALLARMEIVPYMPLDSDTLRSIVKAKLEALEARIRERHRHADVVLEEALVEAICQRATRSENGARMLESVIDGELLPPLSRALLDYMARQETVTRIVLGMTPDNRCFKAEVV